MSINETKDSQDEAKEFFESLNEENENKYINYIKNPSIKFWTFLNENGLTPLHQSISLNLYKLSKEMLKVAKNNLTQEEFLSFINSGTNKGQTPLHYASYVGNIKLIKLLISNFAEINALTNTGYNMIHKAAMGNKPSAIVYFNKKLNIFVLLKNVARCKTVLSFESFEFISILYCFMK